jgi:hypothetical protein
MIDIEKEARRDANAAKYLELEPEICDLDRMAEIAEGLVAEWSLADMRAEPTRKQELAVYAVQQLRKRCAELKELYCREDAS